MIAVASVAGRRNRQASATVAGQTAGFGEKAVTKMAVDVQHIERRQTTGLKPHQAAGIRSAGDVRDPEVAALPAIGAAHGLGCRGLCRASCRGHAVTLPESKTAKTVINLAGA